ncbi:MAG: hypothetical protein IE926_16465, partial [Micrococcales bacterium]|nr:hypothetical protein [Micrococcales bacterium]
MAPALRDARWPDLGGLAALETTLFPDDAWSPPSWWAELAARPRRDYVVAEADGALVGYAGLDHGGEVSDELRARLDSYNDVQARLQRLLASSGPDHPQVPGLQQTLVSTAERLFIELQAQRAEAQSTL